MKNQKLAVLSLALLVGALVPAFALASEWMSFGATSAQAFKFTRSAPTVAASAMSYQDTVTVLSSADSIRTSNINTSNWDWTGAWVGTSTGNVVRAVAVVVFYIPPGYNQIQAGDSLTFAVEPSFDNGLSYVCNLNPLASAVGAHALGNNAVSGSGLGVTGLTVNVTGGLGGFYRGYLVMDSDSAPTLALNTFHITGYRDFRLKVFGDALPIGTLTGFIYPIRRVSG